MSPGFPTDNPAERQISLRKEAADSGVQCTVSGWGQVGGKENTLPKILQIASVFLIPYEECRSRFTNNTERSIQPGMICADNSGREVDACDVSTASILTQ